LTRYARLATMPRRCPSSVRSRALGMLAATVRYHIPSARQRDSNPADTGGARMPRIRTLKPDHRLHRKVGGLDHTTYRLWVGMILEADDAGRLVAERDQLKALIFGLSGQTRLPDIDRGLKTLHALGLIHIYTAEGVHYAWFPSWKDHQRISHPAPSRLPVCPAELERMAERSSRAFQNPPEPSAKAPEHSTGKGSGSGKEGKGSGREGNGEGNPDYQFAIERLKAKHKELT